MEYSHPKCYAKHLKNCSQRISREHYISENVLGLLGKIKVDGCDDLRRSPDGTTPLASITASILCEKHNSELSPLDQEAGKFFEHFRKLLLVNGNIHDLEVDGPKMERWFLKVFIGMFKAGLLPNGKIPDSRVENLVDILFEKNEWLYGHGLWLMVTTGDNFKPSDSISIKTSIGDYKEILVADIDLGGLVFCLFMVMPKKTDYMVYRIRHINFIYPKNKTVIEFKWPGEVLMASVEIRASGVN